ncbi:hypothetical protein F5Y06DRAFT_113964 [Hypoxylon sp. FL0890]|nr:hypothetical protein F5Y06DRAFT_113964 [Hypoxylon sp. FL0890]
MEQPILDPKSEQRAVGKSARTLVSSRHLYSTGTSTDYSRRPLRTYSKRTSSTDTSEPVSRKRRNEEISSATAPEDAPKKLPHQPSVPYPSPTLPPSQPAKKGTIMSYFRVIPPSSDSTLYLSEPRSGSVEPTSTPPSSPPVSDRQRKKRRRLTTRVISRDVSEDPQMEEDQRVGENEESDAMDDRFAVSAGRTNALEDAKPDILNRPATRHNNRSDSGKRGRVSKSATVQTTLSLSAAEKGFTECKECNMLYNPLHKQDAKCHARRHAAMLKAKSSSNDNEAPN